MDFDRFQVHLGWIFDGFDDFSINFSKAGGNTRSVKNFHFNLNFTSHFNVNLNCSVLFILIGISINIII